MTKRQRRMIHLQVISVGLLVLVLSFSTNAQQKKPNILFIMGDDIGWMQPSCYHRGLMVGETPNIDRLATEGGMFMCYYAEQSCTSGRNAFFTGMHPLRTGMIPPQLPGSPSYLRPGTPALAKFLLDLGYNTGEFGKNHLGDHPDALYYTMSSTNPLGAMGAKETYGWTMVDNIMRDPFEIAGGLDDPKSAISVGGALASPSTAYLYDWNLLPLGQLLWEKELMSYIPFPPLQAPETYNLSGILKEVQAAGHPSQ